MSAEQNLLKEVFHLDNMPNGNAVYIYEYDERHEEVLEACRQQSLLFMNRDKRITIQADAFEEVVLGKEVSRYEEDDKGYGSFEPSKELEDFFNDLDSDENLEDEATIEAALDKPTQDIDIDKSLDNKDEALLLTDVLKTEESETLDETDPDDIDKDQPQKDRKINISAEIEPEEDEDIVFQVDDAIKEAAEAVPGSGTNLLIKEQEILKREQAVTNDEQALIPREEKLMQQRRELKNNKATKEVEALEKEEQELQSQLESFKKERRSIRKFKEQVQKILDELVI